MSEGLQTMFFGLIGGIFTWLIIEFIRGYRKRIDILAGLIVLTNALDSLSSHNKTATDDLENPPPHILPIEYPIMPFEMTIFSENGISVQDSTREAVSTYWNKARELNIVIEALQNSHFATDTKILQERKIARKFIQDQVTLLEPSHMPTLISRLKAALVNEKRLGLNGFTKGLFQRLR